MLKIVIIAAQRGPTMTRCHVHPVYHVFISKCSQPWDLEIVTSRETLSGEERTGHKGRKDAERKELATDNKNVQERVGRQKHWGEERKRKPKCRWCGTPGKFPTYPSEIRNEDLFWSPGQESNLHTMFCTMVGDMEIDTSKETMSGVNRPPAKTGLGEDESGEGERQARRKKK